MIICQTYIHMLLFLRKFEAIPMNPYTCENDLHIIRLFFTNRKEAEVAQMVEQLIRNQ